MADCIVCVSTHNSNVEELYIGSIHIATIYNNSKTVQVHRYNTCIVKDYIRIHHSASKPLASYTIQIV